MRPVIAHLQGHGLAVRVACLSAFLAWAPAAPSTAGPHAPTPAQGTAAAPPPEATLRPLPEVIDGYVREALTANLALHESGLDLERAMAALDEARAGWRPSLGLEARYTRARGGREIDIPLGSIVNPIYSSLNALLAAQGRPAPFGALQNQTILFQREREQDTRLTLRQVLYAPAVPAAVRAQRAGVEAAEYARTALARRVKRDVTVAYLEWLRARHEVGIVAASRSLLDENLRVADSLWRNGRVTQDQVLRARAELLAKVQALTEARNRESEARRYANFLLNRALDEPLEPAASEGELRTAAHDLPLLRAAALASRPELAQLDSASRAAQARQHLARAGQQPSLALGVDAGTQDERYDFGHGRNFAMISLLLSWKFFDGGAARAAERGARAEQRRTETQREELARQIELEVSQALERLEASGDSLATAQARADAAQSALRIATRKRDEGVIPQVEFIDAQNALTAALLNLETTRCELLERQAELDYSTAAGALPL